MDSALEDAKEIKAYFSACKRGDFGKVHALLRKGMTPSQVDDEGWTAAGRACAAGRTGVVGIMLELGLDASLTGQNGVSLLHVAASKGRHLVVRQL